MLFESLRICLIGRVEGSSHIDLKRHFRAQRWNFKTLKRNERKKIKLQKQTPALVKFLSIDLYLFFFYNICKGDFSRVRYTIHWNVRVGTASFYWCPIQHFETGSRWKNSSLLKLRKKFHNQASINRCGLWFCVILKSHLIGTTARVVTKVSISLIPYSLVFKILNVFKIKLRNRIDH